MPTVSRMSRVMLISSTARTMPRRVVNSTVRSRASSSGIAVMLRAPLRVDDVAQAVAQKIEAEHRDHQRGAGKERNPPFARNHEGCALRDHDAPLGGRRAGPRGDERPPPPIEKCGAPGQRQLPHPDWAGISAEPRPQGWEAP